MSQSRWNPKYKRPNDDTLTIPGDVPFVGTYITQQDRDEANKRTNALIHSVHQKLGNVKVGNVVESQSIADDEDSDDSGE